MAVTRPMALSEITGRDFSAAVPEYGAVVENLNDIDQCIRILLATPKGSRPHEPLFGCDAWKYLDAPLGEAVPRIIREIVEAINMWEPRCAIKRIAPDYDGAASGHLRMTLEWTLPNYEESRVTEVTL